VTETAYLYAGPALASAGPDSTHFRGPTHRCAKSFEGVHQGVMIDIGDDVTTARPERATSRPLQQRLQWTAPLEKQ